MSVVGPLRRIALRAAERRRFDSGVLRRFGYQLKFVDHPAEFGKRMRRHWRRHFLWTAGRDDAGKGVVRHPMRQVLGPEPGEDVARGETHAGEHPVPVGESEVLETMLQCECR